MTIAIFNEQQLLEKINSLKNPFFEEYHAFYSSWFDGVIKNPQMMMVPIDDHLVHRGDGVFERMKAVNRSVYLMDEHLQRLFKSADDIALKPYFNINQIKEIILETLRAADQNEAMIRVYFSRGPGGFTVNPYESIKPQLYVMITALRNPPAKKYENGVIIGESDIAPKPAWMAQIKSCNYLPNVLMKKEAVDRHLDFVIGFDAQGFVTESATENLMIVDQKGIIVHPKFDHVLKGTTMIRACKLARENGFNTEIRSISKADLKSAREAMLAGTTLDILPAVKFEDYKINDGKPGSIAKRLQELMQNDISSGNRSIPY